VVDATQCRRPRGGGGLEGLSQLEDARTKLRAGLEGALGYALAKSSQLPEALRHYEQGLAIRREIGDHKGEAVTLNNISQIYRAWGRYDEALKLLEQSLAIQREIGDRAGEAATSWNLGLEYERRGDLARGLPLLESSVRIKEALTHPDLERDQAYLAALKNRIREPGAEPSSSGVEPMIPRSDPK